MGVHLRRRLVRHLNVRSCFFSRNSGGMIGCFHNSPRRCVFGKRCGGCAYVTYAGSGRSGEINSYPTERNRAAKDERIQRTLLGEVRWKSFGLETQVSFVYSHREEGRHAAYSPPRVTCYGTAVDDTRESLLSRRIIFMSLTSLKYCGQRRGPGREGEHIVDSAPKT